MLECYNTTLEVMPIKWVSLNTYENTEGIIK